MLYEVHVGPTPLHIYSQFYILQFHTLHFLPFGNRVNYVQE